MIDRELVKKLQTEERYKELFEILQKQYTEVLQKKMGGEKKDTTILLQKARILFPNYKNKINCWMSAFCNEELTIQERIEILLENEIEEEG